MRRRGGDGKTDVPIEVTRNDYSDSPYDPGVEVGVQMAQDWLDSLPEDAWQTPTLRAYGFIARTFMRAHRVLPHRDRDDYPEDACLAHSSRVLGERDSDWLWQRRRRLRVNGAPLDTHPENGEAEWWYGAEDLSTKELRRLLPLLERLVVAVVADTAAEMEAAT